jgi:hypothetical protein
MRRFWWYICDCLFGSPWAITELQATYENSRCPHCRQPISHDATPGDECSKCGHLLWLNESRTTDRTAVQSKGYKRLGEPVSRSKSNGRFLS